MFVKQENFITLGEPRHRRPLPSASSVPLTDESHERPRGNQEKHAQSKYGGWRGWVRVNITNADEFLKQWESTFICVLVPIRS